jgi:hypothetical protein
MASPVGHALAGYIIARRLGIKSPEGITAAVVAAGLPDVDVLVGALMHRDPWKIHKQVTHTYGFAAAVGMAAGAAGVVSTGTVEGERDLPADALLGALLVGSHIVMDRVWMPYLDVPKRGPLRRILVRSAWNWAVDAIVYGFLAAKLTRGRQRET